ncbi:hypothetical protein FE783_11570 [Paenibacillus mesophilus]|uniref:hypothetical protein n=1 Tax=Paenibacillus mesophilus TaxID=2582849 RepID=UPI00110EFF7F|nr:hypothetical protein [Paenibacillus mesophilus]TMV50192.1 hypothetical protein FE783_11570 [Paenibacillus mesophilus]
MEEELIEYVRRFVAGDASCFEEIYNGTISRVYRTAYFLSDRESEEYEAAVMRDVSAIAQQ